MNISQITETLYVGGEPKRDCTAELLDRKIKLVISMVGWSHPREKLFPPPIHLLWLRAYDFFFSPIPIRLLADGVKAALPVIQKGHSVFTFCAHGRHRSVAMAAAILIAQGHSADDALRLIKAQRKIADPRLWYIRDQVLLFEQRWKDRQNPLRSRDRLYDAYCEKTTGLLSRIFSP